MINGESDQTETERNEDLAVYNILIVDDDPRFRAGVQRLFYVLGEDMMYRGFEAGGGVEALAMLRRHSVDCVLLDYRMPCGNNLEWLLRFVQSNRTLPVVMVTGAGDEEMGVLALKNGAMDYLVKGSITPEALRRAITNAIEKMRMRTELERLNREVQEAVRQRAMVQSLSEACRRLRRPVTLLRSYMDMLQHMSLTADADRIVDESGNTIEQLLFTLHEIQIVCAVRVTSYRPRSGRDPGHADAIPVDVTLTKAS